MQKGEIKMKNRRCCVSGEKS